MAAPSRSLKKRIPLYVIGLIVLAAGIDMNTKTQLGISPIISVAYNISAITGISLGLTTFVYYVSLIFLQLILLKGKLPVIQWLQVAASFVTSLFIQIFDGLIPVPESYPGKFALLAAAILVTALGVVIVVCQDIVPNPADGLAKAVAQVLHKSLGFGKNVIDLVAVIISLLIGLIARGHVMNIGIGTLLSVIFVGRAIALIQYLIDRR